MIHTESAFEKILKNEVVDLPLFKNLCKLGIPHKYRWSAYQVLLEISLLRPCNNKEKEKIKSYRAKLQDAPNAEGVLASKYPISESLMHQIHIDVLRIPERYKKYNSSDISYIFVNVLCIIAHKRPYVGYVQGMADLVVPFSELFFSERENPEYLGLSGDRLFRNNLEAEASIYIFVNRIVSLVQHNLVDMQQRLIGRLDTILRVVDAPLAECCDKNGFELHMCCVRWFTCLFIREFPINSWYRIFDYFLSGDIEEPMIYFAASILIWFRDKILHFDLAEIILFLQNLCEENISPSTIEELIGSSCHIKNVYLALSST
ncbi:TBC1 domain family member 2 [Enteropsectra breve]|nr:TBC1 domain family member 2 [Enteropsectra breve]